METHATLTTKIMKRSLAFLLFLSIVPGAVVGQLSGTKTVCSSGCNYTTLTGAAGLFNDINNNGLGGNLTVTINSDITESGAVALNSISVGAANTITIKPGSAVLYSITGNSTSAATTPLGLIRINGADNVTINGNFGGSGKYLLFRNANSASSGANTVPALAFDGGATNDVVTNCYIESNATNALRAPVLISSNGTNSVTISGCDIRNTTAGAAGRPNTAINSTGAGNTVQVLNNNIYNFTQTGVSITNTTNACTVTGNSIYSTLGTTIDLADVAGIYILSGSGHTISNNYIGGSGPLCAGTWNHSADAEFTGIFVTFSSPAATSLQGNTIQNIYMSNPDGPHAGCTLMSVSTGSYNVGTVAGNTLGDASNPTSILIATDPGAVSPHVGLKLSGSGGTLNIANNVIAGMTTTNALHGTVMLRGIDYSSNTTLNLTNNSIHDLTTTSITYQDAVTGIYTSGSGTKTISGNIIYNLQQSTVTMAMITGIYIAAGSNTLSNNRIYGIKTAGSVGSLYGVHLSGGSTVMTNNQISLTNSPYTGVNFMFGVFSTGTSNATLYYNSVYIAGSSIYSAANSFAFLRQGTGTTTLTNNIFYNERVAPGYACAIGNDNASPTTGWGANASNYNLLVSADTNYMGYWGSGLTNLSNWKTSSGGDGNSWCTIGDSIVGTNLFTDPENGNLNIVTTNPKAWYVNGRGVQIPGITGDYGSALAGRSTTVANGAPDIGSDEMVPSSVPPAVTLAATFGIGYSCTFVFAGRTIGSLQWTAGSVLLSASMTYYPGTNPPNSPNNHYCNGYWNIAINAFNSPVYNLTLNYDPAMLGTATESGLKIAKKPGTVWTYLPTSTVNTTTKTVSFVGMTNLGDFTLTDNIVPLPVRLTSFTASAKGDRIDLDWASADEIVDRYTVERSANGTDYEYLATVKARGCNSTYSYSDATAASGINYYRLKMADNTGNADYSNTVTAAMDKADNRGVSVYPNPAKDMLHVYVNATTTTPVKLYILDLTGRVVYNTSASTSNMVIDLKGLANGHYQLHCDDGTQKEMILFVKE